MLTSRLTQLAMFCCVVLFLASCSEYKKTESGLRYKIVVDSAGEPVKEGQVVFFKSKIYRVQDGADSLLREADDDGILIEKEFRKGDVEEGIRLLGLGDSAVFVVSVDTFYSGRQQQIPEILKKAQEMKFCVKVVRVATKEVVMQEQMQQMQQRMQQQMQQYYAYKSAVLADSGIKAQMVIDDKLIQKYLKSKGIKAQKTQNGVYYSVTSPGTGEAIKAGDPVLIHYTGYTMNDGKIFDSSKNSGQPFEVMVGDGRVIIGWEEALTSLKKGDKVTIIIPSSLAYGKNPNPEGPIPVDACLVFDLEILNQ